MAMLLLALSFAGAFALVPAAYVQPMQRVQIARRAVRLTQPTLIATSDEDKALLSASRCVHPHTA
jgi:hypothetical protein